MAGDGTHGAARTLHSRSPAWGSTTMAELCARYGVSRKTGYKWLARFDAGGRLGLARSEPRAASVPAPHRGRVGALICAARRQHPELGAREASWTGWGRASRPLTWPAVSTAGDLLARHGLVKKRRRRRRYAASRRRPADHARSPTISGPPTSRATSAPRDGVYCYPLTVADQHTRYLLACHGLLSTQGHGVRPVFDRLFREYGLPRAIRTDNGVPFATHRHSMASPSSTSGGCASAFSISASGPPIPNRTAPTNGCTGRSRARRSGRPAATLGAQQRAFNRFRPALQRGAAPPSSSRAARRPSLYRPSPRALHRRPAARRVSRPLHRQAGH